MYNLTEFQVLPANVVEGHSNILETQVVECDHSNKHYREWKHLDQEPFYLQLSTFNIDFRGTFEDRMLQKGLIICNLLSPAS